jgi:hypothetical protein
MSGSRIGRMSPPDHVTIDNNPLPATAASRIADCAKCAAKANNV